MKKSPEILLVGAGNMALEYAKVLKKMHHNFIVVGRSNKSANNFEKVTDTPVFVGGVHKWLTRSDNLPKIAIVASSHNTLGKVTKELLHKGFKLILVEKPGGFDWNEITMLNNEAKKFRANIYVAYNRRFYTSVKKAKEIIKKDGGILSFDFEFTEWSHIIKKLKFPPKVKEWWFLHNSTHVVDMAFFLGGTPKPISSYTKSHLKWQPKASIFTGAGITIKDIPFSYRANWESPGRWGVEIMTKKHRLVFRPLEKLFIQTIGSVDVTEYKINDKMDTIYKPGIYYEVKSFLTNKENLCTIEEQFNNINFYKTILGENSKISKH